MVDLDWAGTHWSKYSSLYRVYGDYYNGKHKNYFSNITEDNKNHQELREILAHLKDNMCKVVVDAIASRLELDGFDCSNEKTQDFIDDYFRKNRIASVAKAVHRDVILYGDGYVLVAPDDSGAPVISCERPYNMAVKYDYMGNMVMAVKWIIEGSGVDKISHYWIYTPEAIYRRKAPGTAAPGVGAFDSLLPDGDKPDIPNPWGVVPVFHFYNGIRKDAFCRSDLGDVLPLQISLNKELQSREFASDLAAFPLKWITGVNIPMDESGQPVNNLRACLDRVWNFVNPDTKLGEFAAADLSNYTNVINDIREEISRVSRVPFHIMGLGGNFPSGEALKTAEAPLVAKIQDKQLLLGDVWEDVFFFVCKLAGLHDEVLETRWANTQPHSEKEQWEIALMKKEAGVSADQILTELGYSQEQIDDFNEKAEAAAASAFAAFNRGGALVEDGQSKKGQASEE